MHTVELSDRKGRNSIMVEIPKFRICDVIEGGSDAVHPAFARDGKELDAMYVSKYQNVVIDGCAYSLKGKDPQVFITIEEAREACKNKGGNWHMMTNDEWAAIALWSLKKGTLPRGNNDALHDWKCPDERGIESNGEPCPKEGKPLRVLTGSGPATWSHDHTEDGIYDMNGNVWEFMDDLRVSDTRIQMRQPSGTWMEINQEGEQVPIGTPKTFCYSSGTGEEGMLCLATEPKDNLPGCIFTEAGKFYENTEIDVPERLKVMALFPQSETELTDVQATNSMGTFHLIRGGYWENKSEAGIFSAAFLLKDTENYFDVGFRCVCY